MRLVNWQDARLRIEIDNRHQSNRRNRIDHFIMSLSATQKKQFRTIGHALNPVVTVAGNGLNEGVQTEIHRALEDHELIKVKFAVGDREIKKALIRELCTLCNAELVQEIGNIALVYRRAEEPNPRLSNLLR